MKKFLLNFPAWACCALLLFGGCRSVPPGIGEPMAGLNSRQRKNFEAGRQLFQQVFTPQQGLGPLFNGAGCATCHSEPVSGGGSAVTEVHASAVTSDGQCDPLFEQGGPVIQSEATPELEALGISGEEVPPGATGVGRRSTPPVFGLGLVDVIPDRAILAREDPGDLDGDGISGRANRFIDGRLGRFGRKAFVPSLFDFNAGAFPTEQGITTPLSPIEETINGRPMPPEADLAADPEITLAEVERVNDYVRFLAPPERELITDPDVQRVARRGEMLFAEIGCARCHVPEMTTSSRATPPLRLREVALYSDLLLHDMGEESPDICVGLATPTEFRTEMLMGLRFRRQFLHDGSASSVREAIERHGGEGSGSRAAFRALGNDDQAALLRFLGSL